MKKAWKVEDEEDWLISEMYDIWLSKEEQPAVRRRQIIVGSCNGLIEEAIDKSI